MTQAEIIERIGFGCNGDRNEALFRAGFRPLRQSPFNPQSYEYVSYTHIDRGAEEEGIAFVRTRALRSGSRTPAMTSDATMRGEASSESNRIAALRADDADNGGERMGYAHPLSLPMIQIPQTAGERNEPP
jgi:hypothetical protein